MEGQPSLHYVYSKCRPIGSLLILQVKRYVNAKVVRMKIQTRIYSRKLPEYIQNAISLDVIQVKNFKILMEKPSLVVILCLCQWHIFQKWAFSSDLKGMVMKIFPGPPFFLASLAPHFSSPSTNFVLTGLKCIPSFTFTSLKTEFLAASNAGIHYN